MMSAQAPNAYQAEKTGAVHLLTDVFAAQHQYLDQYVPAISTFSVDDGFESLHWAYQAPNAGHEIEHLSPFRAKLWQMCKLAELTDVHEFKERFNQWPYLQVMRQGGVCTSPDGQVQNSNFVLLSLIAMLCSIMCTMWT